MNVTEQPAGRRASPTASRPEVRLVATGRMRVPGRLDHGVATPPEDPPLDALLAAIRGLGHAESWMIAGGEPTLRADFPRLVRALADAGAPALGVVTDGLALAAPAVVGQLRDLGLRRVRVRLHAGRHDAHDWLAGQTGAWRRAVKALKACADAGLEAEVECTITRPTFAFAEESVELFARLGARAVLLRRVTSRGPAAAQDVALAPRFGLISREVEAAVQTGGRLGLAVMVEGFPRCALPSSSAAMLQRDAVVWALPAAEGWTFLRPFYEAVPTERGCAGCPGPAPDSICCGAPSDYVRRFGRTEIDSESVRLINPGKLDPTPLQGGDVYPPPRAGRFPASRLAYARLSARLPSLGGDPLAAVRVPAGQATPDVLRTVFVAPPSVDDPVLGDRPGPVEPESTRAARIRLVKLAQHGARTLRIAGGGALSHPNVGELLREATRLQFPRIEIAGEASGLDACSDMELRRLRGISRVDVALFGPDAASHDAIVGRPGAFDAAMRALDRLGTLVPSLEVGAYAVLTSHEPARAFVEAWDFGDLPGAPFFRLAPRGGSLHALAEVASGLPQGPARDALAAVLPIALLPRPEHVRPAPEAQPAWGEVPEVCRKPSGSDRHGCYTDRLDGDPGVAVGWSTEA